MSTLFLYIIYAQDKHINLIHIESRKSKQSHKELEIFVDCDTDQETLKELNQLQRKDSSIVAITPSDTATLPGDGRSALTF